MNETVERFGSLDSVILNAGTLDPLGEFWNVSSTLEMRVPPDDNGKEQLTNR